MAAALTMSACGGDSPSEPLPPATPVGSYVLQTVNGKVLPAVLASDTSYTFELTAGSLAVTSDGQYTEAMNYRQTILGNVELFVDSTNGSWTGAMGAATFVDAFDSTSATVTWTRTGLTWSATDPSSAQKMVFVFARTP